MDAIDNLDLVHPIVAPLKLDSTDELFWSNGFSSNGAALAAQAAPSCTTFAWARTCDPVAATQSGKGESPQRDDPDMLFAAWRLDTLG